MTAKTTWLVALSSTPMMSSPGAGMDWPLAILAQHQLI